MPRSSASFTDDGITKVFPGAESGRLLVSIRGGIPDVAPISPSPSASFDSDGANNASTPGGSGSLSRRNSGITPLPPPKPISGVKVAVDFVSSFDVRTEAKVMEFPELDIYDNQKMITSAAGQLSGSLKVHLQPPVSLRSLDADENQYVRASEAQKRGSGGVVGRRLLYSRSLGAEEGLGRGCRAAPPLLSFASRRRKPQEGLSR
jgi:hypothetical protein